MSKSPSLRRIQADVRELAFEPSDRYHASPLENDMFEWHFTIRGADGTDFQGGIYHGRILLPPEYPFKPPHILFLTPSGRFETNTKVCLSFSAFHPELWQPAWGIRLILEALIAFLPSPADGAIGALDWTSEERKRLALASQSYCCPKCGRAADLLPKIIPQTNKDDNTNDASSSKKEPSKSRFEKEIELLRMAQASNEKNNKRTIEESATTTTTTATTRMTASSSSTSVNTDDAVADETENHPPELIQEQDEPTTTATTTAAVATTTTTTPPPLVTELLNHENTSTPNMLGLPEQGEEEEPRAAVVVTVTTPDHVVPQNAEHPHEGMDISWLTDPMLNFAIVLLSIICFLLGCKAMDLLEELNSLGAVSL